MGKDKELRKVWDRQQAERDLLGLPDHQDELNQMEEEKLDPREPRAKRSTISVTAVHHKNLKFIAAEGEMSLNEAIDRIFDRLFNDFEGLTVAEMKQWGDRVRSLNE